MKNKINMADFANLKKDIDDIVKKYTDNNQLLKDIFESLRNKINKKFILDFDKGIRLGRKWIICENPQLRKNVINNRIISQAESFAQIADNKAYISWRTIFLCGRSSNKEYMINQESMDTILLMLTTSAQEFEVDKHFDSLYEIYTYYDSSHYLSKYIGNLFYFCIGAHFYSVKELAVKKKHAYRQIAKRFCNTEDKTKVQKLTSNYFIKALKYFIVMSIIGLSNMFNTDILKDECVNVTKAGILDIKQVFKDISIDDDYFYFIKKSLKPESNLLKYFQMANEEVVDFREHLIWPNFIHSEDVGETEEKIEKNTEPEEVMDNNNVNTKEEVKKHKLYLEEEKKQKKTT